MGKSYKLTYVNNLKDICIFVPEKGNLFDKWVKNFDNCCFDKSKG